MDIVQHINELLYNHECVIIPDFGGFVSSYKPASIHPVQHQFYPPSKNILYNEALKSNDGLLANHIASRNKISYEQAMEHIREYTLEIRELLNDGKPVELKNIGRLYTDRDGIICFEQNQKTNFLKEVYGMASFVSPAVKRVDPRINRTAKPVLIPGDQQSRKKQRAGMLVKVAASVAILILLGFAGMNYVGSLNPETQQLNILATIGQLFDGDNNNISDAPVEKADEEKTVLTKEADWKPISKELTAAELEKPEPEAAHETSTDVISETVDQPSVAEEKTSVPEEFNTVASNQDTKVVQRKYHLIAGSFKETLNAELLINEYLQKGFTPELMGPSDNGYYRVSISAFIRKDEALAELKKVREDINPNIWLLRQ